MTVPTSSSWTPRLEARDLLLENTGDFVCVDHVVCSLASLVLSSVRGEVVEAAGDRAVDAAVAHRDAHAADQVGIDDSA